MMSESRNYEKKMEIVKIRMGRKINIVEAK